jgi:hypothetical protein
LTPSPIRKVLSTFRKQRVHALLMGGQAVILYGAAEFSRDTDFAVLCEPQNLQRLRAALKDLRAEPVFVPPLEARYLLRGHACHFRCHAPGVKGLRVDIMSVMRGCDPFPLLWQRRTQWRLPGLGVLPVLSLPDLVTAKKTQRDKDWPMIRRLLEADFFSKQRHPRAKDVRFWLREMRSPELLTDLTNRYSRLTAVAQKARPLLRFARARNIPRLQRELEKEERREREADRRYWQPLRRELEMLRRKKTML